MNPSHSRPHGTPADPVDRHRPRHGVAATLALALALALAVAACGGDAGPTTTTTTTAAADSTTTTEADLRIRVVATTTIIGDILANVVGDAASIEVLLPVGADPHDFAASSRQVAAMQEADLVVANGLMLEEGLVDVLDAVEAAGTPVIRLAELVEPIPYGDHDYDPAHEDDDHGHENDDHEGEDHGHEDDDHGHDHGEFDPHVWMDPARMAAAVLLIADALSEIAPDNDWMVRAQAYADELVALDEEIAALVAALPHDRRLLVTNHDSLGYFAARYDFRVVGTLIPGGTTLGAPSPAELARLVDLIEHFGIPAIFAENVDATALAAAIAAEVGHAVEVVVLTTDSLGEPGSEADTLVRMLRSNARLIVDALGS